ncbi:MAG: hypothetical protein LBF09_06435 [Odoribacteraceae bacterium]|jgi:hypothetical protein|nr:hypothetical protein [Odoribacteraceae bacterium]
MSIEQIIQTRRLPLLFLLPFLLAGIIAAYRYTGEIPRVCHAETGILLSFLDKYRDARWLFWSGAAWLLLLSYLLFFISDRREVFSRATALTAFIYLILSAGVFCHHGTCAHVIAALPVVLALSRLQLVITRLNSNAPLFDFGLLIVFPVLFCPKLVLLLPWAISVLPLSGRTTLRDVMALFLGFFTALLLVSAYFFLFDDWEGARERFMNTLRAGEWPDYHFHPRTWVAIVLLVAVTLVAVSHALTRTLHEIVSRRRGLLSIISLSFFLGGTFFLVPLHCHAFLFILFIPLSYLHASYLVAYGGRWTGRLVFLALVTAGILMIP